MFSTLKRPRSGLSISSIPRAARRRAQAAGQQATARPLQRDGLLDAFDAQLPFTLTAGQREVGDEPQADLAKASPMQRLLQGEVGSGKTVVALSAALIAVVVAILLPFTMVNVWTALLTLDEELYEMGKSFSRHRWRRLRYVVLPAILPAVVASARISYGVGWKVGIVAELFGVTTGLGYLLNYGRTVFDVDLIYAVTLVIVIVVLLVDAALFAPLERYLTRHRADTVRPTARAG